MEYVSAAGLAELLSGPGPYTVFAPDNSAFASLAPDTLQALAEDGDLLKNVLSYHVVSGNIASKDISNDLTVDTLEGTAIRANVYLQSKFYDVKQNFYSFNYSLTLPFVGICNSEWKACEEGGYPGGQRDDPPDEQRHLSSPHK